MSGEIYRRWLIAAMERSGVSQAELGRALSRELNKSVERDIINKVKMGRRKLKDDEAIALSRVLGIQLPLADAKRTVPLVGFVGAGAQAHMFNAEQTIFEEVEAPPAFTDRTVAVEVRGNSMEPFAEDGSIVYYDNVEHGLTDECIGKICVVRTIDGHTLVKRLYRGTKPGLWSLVSINGPAINDVELEWAAKVRFVRLP